MPAQQAIPSLPVLLGRFRITGVLGRGAMGMVYGAFDPVIERTVAVKTINLRLEAEESRRFKERFYREAKAAGGLNHPHIVTIYDVAESDGNAYIAMELLEGLSLRQIIDAGSRPSTTRTARIIAEVADALAYAHDHGVIHRDIKPANIVLTKSGLTKITDFGIAQIPATSSTQPGLLIGSPRYMSPEQLSGGSIDGRSDIFSLGVVLYELLTGKGPFEGKDLGELMYCILHKAPPPPSRLAPTTPAGLDDVVARALAKNPDDRFQNARDFARALRAFQASPGVTAPQNRRGLAKPTQSSTEKVVSSLILPTPLSNTLTSMKTSRIAAANGGPRSFGFVALGIATGGVFASVAINQFTPPIEPLPLPTPVAVNKTSRVNEATPPISTPIQLAGSAPAIVTVIPTPPAKAQKVKPRSLSSDHTSELEERLKKLRRELDELRTKFTELHPDVMTKKRHIEELEKRKAEKERS